MEYEIASMGTGSTFKAITKNDVYTLRIPSAPFKLQEVFSIFVQQTDKSKFEIQQSLEKLETLKKALMQKYFG
jgi:type I restriction enzyme S subunit